MIRPFWLIPTLLSFSRPRRSVAWSTLPSSRSGQLSSTSSSAFVRATQAFLSSSSSSSSSSLQVSSVAQDSVSQEQSNNSDDKNWQTKALALNQVTTASFGGLPYWKTTTTNDNDKKAFRVVFVLGGPGAGKGTQSAFLEEQFPVAHFSVGELLRAEQDKPDSPHGALIQKALVAGSIVPVEISLALLQQAMQKAAESDVGQECIFLVDGFPRNADNLSGWCRFMAEPSIADLWGVLVYTCPEKVLEERILERAKLSGRSDDNLESVRKRFRTFQEQTQPIIDELDAISKELSQDGSDKDAAVWKVWEIAGDQTLPDVTKNTQQMFNQLIRNDILSANQKLLHAIETGNAKAYQTLCDPVWFEKEDDNHDDNDDTDMATAVMKQQEGSTVGVPVGDISNARMEFITGKHVIVSYQRQMGGQQVRESRVWVHNGTDGWQTNHFSRTPAASS